MNLVRGYLLVDKPSEAGTALHAGKPGDEIAAFGRLDEILQVNPVARVYRVLLRLEKARVAGALDVFEEMFATLREAGLLVAHFPRSAFGAWSMRLPPAGATGNPAGPGIHIPAPVTSQHRRQS
jgi:hypothetical protein